MKTSKITKADIESSVLSVPPLARRADYSIDRDGNARILAHLRAGGVRPSCMAATPISTTWRRPSS